MKRLIIIPEIKLYENVEFLLNSDFIIKLRREKAPSGDQVLATLLDGTGGCNTESY